MSHSAVGNGSESETVAAAPAQAQTFSTSAATPSSSRLRILVTFPLPAPSISLLLSHPSFPDLHGRIELVTCEGDMEVIDQFYQQLSKHAPIDGLFCRPGNRVDKEALTRAGPQLRVITTYSVGFEHIDVKEASRRGIIVGNCPNTVTETTADTALAILLAAARLIVPAHENVVRGEWGASPFSVYHLAGQDVYGSTVGIVGFGRIGLAVARRLHHGFGCRILYCSRSGPKPEAAKEVNAEYVSFDELLSQSDFVLPQCPLNDSTRHLFNDEAFNKMKPSAVFVNTTRGGVVDQMALYRALTSGKIFAAGLDVTDPEPLPATHPLVGLPNCLIVPHIGTSTMACRHWTAEQAILNLFQALTGREEGGSAYFLNKQEALKARTLNQNGGETPNSKES